MSAAATTPVTPTKAGDRSASAAPAGKSLDARYADLMRRHFDAPERLVQDWLLYVKRHHQLSRLLHHYEIFRMIRDVPGSIAELGVFRGETLLLWAKFLEIFCMGDRTRTVYGFDHFEGLKDLTPEDGPENAAMFEGAYDPRHDTQQLLELIALFDEDRFAPGKPRIRLVDGDVVSTLPHWAQQNPGVRLSLLHLDLDLYEPTKVALEVLYPRVVPGGVVVFDEFGFENFPGESRAFEDVFGADAPRLRKFDWFGNPGAYFVKGRP